MDDTSKIKKRVHGEYDWKRDKSFFSLLFSNIFSIFLIGTSNSDVFTILTIYWAQTLIMGLFAYVRISKIRRRGKHQDETKESSLDKEGKRKADRFLSTYLFIQIVPLMFVCIGYSVIDFWVVLLASTSFFLSHLYSFKYNYQELISTGNRDSIIFDHITRSLLIMLIIPVILICLALVQSIIPLLVLKAYVDQMMHMAKHDKKFKWKYIENILKVLVIMVVSPFLLPVLYYIFGIFIIYLLEITGLYLYLGY